MLKEGSNINSWRYKRKHGRKGYLSSLFGKEIIEKDNFHRNFNLDLERHDELIKALKKEFGEDNCKEHKSQDKEDFSGSLEIKSLDLFIAINGFILEEEKGINWAYFGINGDIDAHEKEVMKIAKIADEHLKNYPLDLDHKYLINPIFPTVRHPYRLHLMFAWLVSLYAWIVAIMVIMLPSILFDSHPYTKIFKDYPLQDFGVILTIAIIPISIILLAFPYIKWEQKFFKPMLEKKK